MLGPAEAPLAVIKGRYRFRLLVKSLRNVDLSEYLREWLAAGPKTKGNLKLEVDVDPQSFLWANSSVIASAPLWPERLSLLAMTIRKKACRHWRRQASP